MAILTKVCEKCGEEFAPHVQNISEKSPMCKECLEGELEKYPVLPPRIRRRS